MPLPGGLVLKSGSKQRASTCRSMPVPESRTRSATRSPTGWSSTRSVPPSGMASKALSSRFSTTCMRWSSTTKTGGVSGS